MGFASDDPGMFSVDLTFSPTFMAGSTSGTSGCKQWHYTQEQERFLETQWEQLAQEHAQGGGPHLVALSHLMGCSEPRWSTGLQEISEFFLTAEAPADAAQRLQHHTQRWACAQPPTPQPLSLRSALHE